MLRVQVPLLDLHLQKHLPILQFHHSGVSIVQWLLRAMLGTPPNSKLFSLHIQRAHNLHMLKMPRWVLPLRLHLSALH